LFAIIKSGGKQYKVEEGQSLKVELINKPEGENIEISDVLLIDTGKDVLLGNPIVKGASVTARIVEHGKSEKVIVFKKKRRKQYKRFKGHRQNFSALQIEKINAKQEN